jgi:hypothetical protein
MQKSFQSILAKKTSVSSNSNSNSNDNTNSKISC